jgi:hypothetical protein
MISFRSDYGESKSVQNGGASMTTTMTMTTTTTTTGSKGIGRSRVLASMAMLFGAIFTILLLPAYGQQEVDPTWYDPAPNTVANAVPSTGPNAVVVHSSQPAVAFHRHEVAVKSVSSAEGSGRSRGTQPATQPKIADIGVPRDRSQEEKVAAIAR